MEYAITAATRPWSDMPRTRDAISGRHEGMQKSRTVSSEENVRATYNAIMRSGADGIRAEEIARLLGITGHAVRRICNRLGYPVYEDDDARLYCVHD